MDHQCIPIEKQMSTIYTYKNIREGWERKRKR